jgi:hypothetical protein
MFEALAAASTDFTSRAAICRSVATTTARALGQGSPGRWSPTHYLGCHSQQLLNSGTLQMFRGGNLTERTLRSQLWGSGA